MMYLPLMFSAAITADNSMGTAFPAEYTLFNYCSFNLVYRYSVSVNVTLPITV
jgi:hypothetical protein